MNILLVGITGMLGGKIARALLDRGATDLRATIRPGGYSDDADKTEAIRSFEQAGVTMVEADLAEPKTLPPAVRNIDVIVSTVQGLRDVIVDGQSNLLQAAESAGVQRFIPSDYSLDFFDLQDHENRNLALRREFDEKLDASSVAGTSILNGAFAEMLLYGFPLLDPDAGVFRVWGDGEHEMDFTTTDDTAQFTAAAALEDCTPRRLHVAGSSLTADELKSVCEQWLGRSLERRHEGTLDQLARRIQTLVADDPNPDEHTFPPWQALQYLHNMLSGRGKLVPLHNDRYPIELTPLDRFLADAPPPRSAKG